MALSASERLNRRGVEGRAVVALTLMLTAGCQQMLDRSAGKALDGAVGELTKGPGRVVVPAKGFGHFCSVYAVRAEGVAFQHPVHVSPDEFNVPANEDCDLRAEKPVIANAFSSLSPNEVIVLFHNHRNQLSNLSLRAS